MTLLGVVDDLSEYEDIKRDQILVASKFLCCFSLLFVVGKCISCFAFVVLNGGVPRLKTMRMNGAVFQVVRACAEG